MASRNDEVSYDRLHHFDCSGVWDEAPPEVALLAEAARLVGTDDAWLINDDTALPKKGRHSAGVAPQYASALGKNANCQMLGRKLINSTPEAPKWRTYRAKVTAAKAGSLCKGTLG